MLPAAFLVSDREVLTLIVLLAAEILTVTGLGAASSTRTKVHLILSNSKGGSTHQPWLKTVRRKLKSLGFLILIFMQMCEPVKPKVDLSENRPE